MADPETINMLVDRVSVIKCHECHSEVDVSRAHSFSVVKCPHCGADLPVPALLGDFVLFKTIGKGAMGAVYQGFDQTLKRHVAIKVILQSLGEDKDFVDNFIREAQALAALNHVNVVQIYSCGKEKGQPYIVMEMINGKRLDDLMNAKGPMSEQRVLEIAMDVANGLRAAHEIGLIHGDIKPQNILLDQRGTAKVVDFGLARSAEVETKSAEIWGTPYYIAPEKARRQKEDHRADIYCLGATLFHALAGRPPFEGETAKDVVIKRLQEPAPNLQDLRPELNDETAHLIARMLEADPFRRYPTYDSMQADLNAALQAARRGPRQVPVTGGAGKGGVGKVLGFLLLVALVLASVWFLVLKQSGEPEPEPVKGKTVMKLVNGKLVPVFIPYEEPVEAAGSEDADAAGEAPVGDGKVSVRPNLPGFVDVVLATREGKGADASVTSKNKKLNAGQESSLIVNHAPAPHFKTYIRFDCSALNLFKCKQPAVRVTVSGEYVHSEDAAPATLTLWGVLDNGAGRWVEGEGGVSASFTGPITWNNAPGNAVSHPSDMLKNQAVELAVLTLDKSLAPGDVLEFVDSAETAAMLKFLQDDNDKQITFALTMTEPAAQGQLELASKNQTAFNPPELHIYSPAQ